MFEFKDNNFKLKKSFNIPVKDLSWLTIYKDILYIISDKNDIILQYDIKSIKIIKEISLPKWAWEWITFDENWQMFLADDDWRVVEL